MLRKRSHGRRWGAFGVLMATVGLLTGPLAVTAGASGWPSSSRTAISAASVGRLLDSVSTGAAAVSAASGSSYSAAVLADNPISYWPLTDPAGSPTARDLQGVVTGTLVGGVVAAAVPGPVSGTPAMSFDGGNCSGISLDSGASALAPASQVTVEAWERTTQASPGMLFRWRTSGYQLDDYSQFGMRMGIVGGDAQIPDEYNDGRWHYIVGTYDGQHVNLYVDGILVHSTPATGSIQYGAGGGVAIGRDGDACDGVQPSFHGDLAQVAVYGHALTPAEVAAHYAAARSQFTCPRTAPMLSAPRRSARPQPLGTYVPQHAATTVDGQPFGPLRTEGNQIVDAGGNPVRLAAVNWYGAESADFVPMGLNRQPVGAIADEIADMGFNAVRLPWSNELVECNPRVSPRLVSANPQFDKQPAMKVFDGVVNALAEAGLMVILDNHLTDAGWCCSASDSNDLWWSSKENTTNYATGQAHWAADWATLIQRYHSQPAVIGVDLRNEPRGAAYWGGTTGGQPDGSVADSSQASPNNPPSSCPVPDSVVACDWRWAAQQEGNAVLAMDRHLLIFVEGTSFSTDLTGAYTSPVLLTNRAKLVYSPHVYTFADYCDANDHSQCPLGTLWEGGGSNGSPPPFDFLANWKGLARALDSQWGFLAESGDNTGKITPIWIGEFGTTSWTKPDKPDRMLPRSDQNKWFRNIIDYLGQQPFSWSYWALNGTESDPGPILPDPSRSFGHLETYGLLNVQWEAANPYLIALLRKIQH
jgi:endoglucanase